nr:hypothetical protein [Pandoravirus massiliensis]
MARYRSHFLFGGALAFFWFLPMAHFTEPGAKDGTTRTAIVGSFFLQDTSKVQGQKETHTHRDVGARKQVVDKEEKGHKALFFQSILFFCSYAQGHKGNSGPAAPTVQAKRREKQSLFVQEFLGSVRSVMAATPVCLPALTSDADHKYLTHEKDKSGEVADHSTAHRDKIPALRVAVIGGRDFADRAVLERCLDDLSASLGRPRAIVSGGATGADNLAAAYACSRGIPLVEFKPDYTACRTPRERRIAPLLRNEPIIKAADVVVAFWDGRSRGTADGLARARRAGLVRYVYDYAGRHRSPP